MSFLGTPSYAGDLSVEDAYAMLKRDPLAMLIDVRTEPEWLYVGVPDVSSLGKRTVFEQWQIYPSMRVAEKFVETLSPELRQLGAEPGSPLVFICRSGVRSRHAAIAMTKAGWKLCYNIADGFEGQLDDKQRRGASGGWRASGLPWTQS